MGAILVVEWTAPLPLPAYRGDRLAFAPQATFKNLNLGGGSGRFGMSSQGPERPVCKPYPAECPSS